MEERKMVRSNGVSRGLVLVVFSCLLLPVLFQWLWQDCRTTNSRRGGGKMRRDRSAHGARTLLRHGGRYFSWFTLHIRGASNLLHRRFESLVMFQWCSSPRSPCVGKVPEPARKTIGWKLGSAGFVRVRWSLLFALRAILARNVGISPLQRSRARSLSWTWKTGHKLFSRRGGGPWRKPVASRAWSEQLLLSMLSSIVDLVCCGSTNSLHGKYPAVVGLHLRIKFMKSKFKSWTLKSSTVVSGATVGVAEKKRRKDCAVRKNPGSSSIIGSGLTRDW